MPLARGHIGSAMGNRMQMNAVSEVVNGQSKLLLIDKSGNFLGKSGPQATLFSWNQVAQEVTSAAELYESGKLWFLGETGNVPIYGALVETFSDELVGSGNIFEGDLRLVGRELPGDDAALVTVALALSRWHGSHQYCANCGQKTEVHVSGWERHCFACGTVHYPRTDPAVIGAVVDESDRLLLARNVAWKPKRVSIVAGFVNMGESAEAAMHREIREEVGLEVLRLRYDGSQAWPFPRSLMLGYTAWVGEPSKLILQEDEIASAAFYSRDELRANLLQGQLVPPGEASIARVLVEQWYGGALPLPHNPIEW